MTTTTVVVGAGGLLGTAMSTTAPRGSRVVKLTGLDWTHPDKSATQIREAHREVLRGSEASDVRVMWCAGGGRVGSGSDAMETELALVSQTVSDLIGMATSSHRISFCLAGSGGGVWSGSSSRILNELVPAEPWHDYGKGKFAQEQMVHNLTAGSPITATVARLSNLYGRPRDGRPLTGLVNHLVNNAIHRRPTGIYVPLDTQRDYISAQSAARIMHRLTDHALAGPAGTTQMRVVAAGRSVTISTLAVMIGRVLGRRIPVTVGHSPTASQQPRALTFASIHDDLTARSGHLAHELQQLVRGLMSWRP